ncbi:MAG: aminopeptidase N [Betaproteobacteria bacterium]|nr:aminopeptidase N [Betaproteobacteria bacterium]
MDQTVDTPPVIRLADYRPPAYFIPSVDLNFDIRDDATTVTARLALARNSAASDPAAPLVLDGDELKLESVRLDGRLLTASEYSIEPERLTIPNVPERFVLETVCSLDPAANTKLMGLYASKTGVFTQCEAEGFRRITWFIDRPDVMSRYTTTIRADKSRYPVLLSNGNPVAQGGAKGGRHWAKWVDPFPKPSYLFAMVAAKLERLDDTFETRSGRKVKLQIYVEPGKLDQAGFAMQALKKAMRWDEQTFGLEVDLDQYMIVAVGDFNMGAMENKGLNIFNTKYVLARPDIATDTDYQNIDRVVAHEYFHNWTGNRVTCRDWFQLSLKEGLTVFRDQEFGADMYSRAVQRIQEVRALRAAQFPEDAGPMAHPVRPQSYIEISNFYTPTVYEKGAEVVRMIQTLLGAANFRKGMDLYIQRHDGQAVTCDDFVQAMQDASGIDLAQFRRWYDQAGTPVVEVEDEFDPASRRYTLTFTQSCPPTPGQPEKQPLHIPLALGLIGPQGKEYPLHLEGEPDGGDTTRVLSLTEARSSYTFVDIPSRPVPSIARGFSAPVNVRHAYSADDLAHLMAYDSDPFNRWEAGQRLAANLMLEAVTAVRSGGEPRVPESFVAAFARVLADAGTDPAFAAEALALPSEGFLAEQMSEVDPDAIHRVRVDLRRQLASSLREELAATYERFAQSGPYSPDAASAGRRSLRNLCLGYLSELDDEGARKRVVQQFEHADNMTDSIAAMSALAQFDWPERSQALAQFYQRWQNEALVLDKWLAVQATSRLPRVLAEVRTLMSHPAFDPKNPNKMRALIGSFCHGNPVRFHAADGSGYAFCAERVNALDPLNPQVAARLARAFDRWRKFDAGRQAHARAALERIRSTSNLSRDTLEVVSRALA